jgi:formate/nitrite transporter FocA (FNT family)
VRRAGRTGVPDSMPKMENSESEQADAKERSSVTPVVIHEAVRREGEEELKRSNTALAWSGLAAGLSMGFSLIAEGLLRSKLPDASWRPLITKLGYSAGFVLVILGRQQLFTENTLTPMLDLFRRKDKQTLLNVARLWAVVLLANMMGALLISWALARTSGPEVPG